MTMLRKQDQKPKIKYTDGNIDCLEVGPSHEKRGLLLSLRELTQ
jgi:hypothetical protein